MDGYKSKSLRNIEEKMQGLDTESLRYRILDSAKQFKRSWVDLGQSLYTVFEDKLYKGWGYTKFEAYTAKEIGIRKQTAMKLLRSYSFLEKEEPAYLKEEYAQSADTSVVPTYETIDVLRLAKNKKGVDKDDYEGLKKSVFEKGKDAREVRKDLTMMMKQRKEIDPAEAWQQRKAGTVRRFLGTLKALKQEIETAKLLPMPLIKEAGALIRRLEEELLVESRENM